MIIDVLEAIVGDVPSAERATEPQAVRREDGSWLFDGLAPVDELKEVFELRSLPDEDRVDYQTVGGFVMTYLRHLPTTGETFDFDGLRFEVVDMDGRRVDKVLVTPQTGTVSDEGEA